jgi:hypothetical protein
VTERDRSQLVIALGASADGRSVRKALDEAAKACGKQVSVWAREVLLAAAGRPSLDRRVDKLEDRMADLERRLDGERRR